MDIRQMNPVQIPAGSSVAGLEDGNPLLGTWRLKSYVVTAATGERLIPYGKNPTGYLSYSADARMQVIGAARGRMVHAGPFHRRGWRRAARDGPPPADHPLGRARLRSGPP